MKKAEAFFERGRHFLQQRKIRWGYEDLNKAKLYNPQLTERILSIFEKFDCLPPDQDKSGKWPEAEDENVDDALLENDDEILKICKQHPIPQESLEDILKVLVNIRNLGNYFFKRKKFQAAFKMYTGASNYFNHVARDFINSVDNHDNLQERTKERILKLELPCRLQLAEMQIMYGQYQEALDDSLDLLLEYDREEYRVRVDYQIGKCYFYQNKYRDARIFIDAAIRKDPWNKEIFDLFAKLENTIEECEQNIQQCSEIIKSQKINFDAYFQRAQNYLFLQRGFDIAISDLNHAKNLTKSKTQEIHEMIAQLEKDKDHFKEVDPEPEKKKVGSPAKQPAPRKILPPSKAQPKTITKSAVNTATGSFSEDQSPLPKNTPEELEKRKHIVDAIYEKIVPLTWHRPHEPHNQCISNGIRGQYSHYWHSIRNMTQELVIDVLFPLSVDDEKSRLPQLFRESASSEEMENYIQAAKIVMLEYLPLKMKLEAEKSTKRYLEWREGEHDDDNRSRYCIAPKSSSSIRVKYYLRQAKNTFNAHWDHKEFISVRRKYLNKAKTMLIQALHLDPESEECLQLLNEVTEEIMACNFEN